MYFNDAPDILRQQTSLSSRFKMVFLLASLKHFFTVPFSKSGSTPVAWHSSCYSLRNYASVDFNGL